MTDQEYHDVLEVIRQELEDVEVKEDGTCHWTDVANANVHIQARLRRSFLTVDPVGKSGSTT